MSSLIAEGRHFVWAGNVNHQAVILDNLAEITPIHVDEDTFFGKIMTDVWPIGGVQTSVDEIGDVFTFAVEKVLQIELLVKQS